MVQHAKTLRLSSDSEVALVLAQAAEASLIVETGGRRYRVVREGDDIWAGYDPEGMREVLKRSAGALVGSDREALKAELREFRDENCSSVCGVAGNVEAPRHAHSLPSAGTLHRHRAGTRPDPCDT